MWTPMAIPRSAVTMYVHARKSPTTEMLNAEMNVAFGLAR